MEKETMTPIELAANRLYFINLLNGDIKCHNLIVARRRYPELAAIAAKLTGEELELLISKIEYLL